MEDKANLVHKIQTTDKKLMVCFYDDGDVVFYRDVIELDRIDFYKYLFNMSIEAKDSLFIYKSFEYLLEHESEQFRETVMSYLCMFIPSHPINKKVDIIIDLGDKNPLKKIIFRDFCVPDTKQYEDKWEIIKQFLCDKISIKESV